MTAALAQNTPAPAAVCAGPSLADVLEQFAAIGAQPVRLSADEIAKFGAPSEVTFGLVGYIRGTAYIFGFTEDNCLQGTAVLPEDAVKHALGIPTTSAENNE
jgi:hypothetical protein